MRVRTFQSFVVLCTLSLIAWVVLGTSLSASATITNTSLKLICRTDDDIILSGMEWNVYEVSSTKVDDVYQLEGEFSEYRVSLEDLSTSSNMLDVANTLENYAVLDRITPANSGITDSTGVVSFADLEVGLYLLSGKSIIIDGKRYTPSAFLMEVEEDSDDAVQLVGYPKYTVKTLSNQLSKYSVKKMWLNDQNLLEDRPSDVIVEIYRDAELYETVTLNDGNGWQYDWDATDTYEWRVKEVQVPDNYMVIYREDETLYYAVNMHSSGSNADFNATNSGSYDGSIFTDKTTSNHTVVTTTPTSNGSGNGSSSGAKVSKTSSVSAVSSATSEMGTAPSISKTTDLTTTVTTAPDNTTNTDNGGVVTSTIGSGGSSNGNSSTTAGGKIGSASTVSNTKNNASNSSETVNKLPQTGQMWLPVPILTLGGIVLIAIGLQLKSKK